VASPDADDWLAMVTDIHTIDSTSFDVDINVSSSGGSTVNGDIRWSAEIPTSM
jgi:hypothetical protein